MKYSGIITRIVSDSIAEEAGLEPGDKLLAVNDQSIRDIIDLSFALADDYVELLIEKVNGEQEILEIEKDYDEDLGIEFESAVFDGIRKCANKCLFCFVDQMAPDMRKSLYVKDDDYRLSFLYGNFVTLTNLTANDIDRIKRLHLSPLYISVHTTNSKLREQMLGNHKLAGQIMEQLKTLIDSGIELHTQVVLCPDINDGADLDKTISDLYALHHNILSLAIVPVGLSRYRDNCYSLNGFTPAQAAKVIDMVSKWQAKCRQESGTSFVYLADEFYIKADYQIPEYEVYDNFPQLENGVGIVRDFLNEWSSEPIVTAGYDQMQYLDVVCGVSAEKVLAPLLAEVAIPNLQVRIIPVENKFFGASITVSGLLTGNDIINALKDTNGPRTGIIIPGVSLRKGEHVFLDDIEYSEITKSLGVPVRAAYNANDLRELIQNFR